MPKLDRVTTDVCRKTSDDEKIYLPSIAALNLGHATRPKPLQRAAVSTLKSAGAETLIFSEYVDKKYSDETRALLWDYGFKSVLVSDPCEYTKGRWHNQILIASNSLVTSRCAYTDGPDELAATNTLSFYVDGYSITGLRIPMYKTSAQWNGYWDWIDEVVCLDIVIGDFNCDPRRGKLRDRRLARFAEIKSMQIVTGENSPSYFGKNGTCSTVDHALVGSKVRVNRAIYVQDGIAPTLSDHAAILVDFN